MKASTFSLPHEGTYTSTKIHLSTLNLVLIFRRCKLEELGAEEYANQYFQRMKALKYKSTWWQLAYTSNDALVGLVMPAENNDGAIIGYLGIVPEQRGHGYANELLNQGTLTLLSNGVTRIRSDVDVNNIPIISAFKRTGYNQFALRKEYRWRHT